MKLLVKIKGSASSGNWGHKGIPGHRGGSAPKGNISTKSIISKKNVSGKSGGYIVEFSDGSKGVWKPLVADDGEHKGENEVAAYKLNRLLGGKEVPKTSFMNLDGNAGTIQDYVSNTTPGDTITVEEVKHASNDSIDNILMMEAIMYNVDRYAGNFLLNKDGDIVAIDHGHSQWKPIRKGYPTVPDNAIFDALRTKEDNHIVGSDDYTEVDYGYTHKFSPKSMARYRDITKDAFLESLQDIHPDDANVAWDNFQKLLSKGYVE